MNRIIESIYRHAFTGGLFEMGRKPANDTYPIVIISIFEEGGVQIAIKVRRLCLRTDLRHYWNYVDKKTNEWNI